MKAKPILITKVDALRRQLDTAIKLYFADGDFIAIHALVYGSFTLAKNLCDKTQSSASFTKWVTERVHPSQRRDLFAALSRAGNFFKHADKDPDGQLEYTPGQYELLMVWSAHMYHAISSELTTPMRIFKLWHFMHHPELCDDPNIRSLLDDGKRSYPERRGEFYDFVSKGMRVAQRRIIGQGNE